MNNVRKKKPATIVRSNKLNATEKLITSTFSVKKDISTSDLIDDAKAILNMQLKRLRATSDSGYGFTQEELNQFKTYVTCIKELGTEERNNEKHANVPEQLEQLSNAELIKLLEESKEVE